MAKRKSIKAFVSHSWKHHSTDYDRLCDMLHRNTEVHFNILSVEAQNPVFLANSGVARNIKEQIRAADVFVIIDTPAIGHSDWLKYEIQTAAHLGKPIVGVWPHGHTGRQRMSQFLCDYATDYSAWNTNSIVSTIEGAISPDGDD
jgi:hypothetical protein